MKKILALFIGLSILTSCTTDDDDSYYNAKTINLLVNNYIKLETQKKKNQNDYEPQHYV